MVIFSTFKASGKRNNLLYLTEQKIVTTNEMSGRKDLKKILDNIDNEDELDNGHNPLVSLKDNEKNKNDETEFDIDTNLKGDNKE